jgi:3-hydroxyacyl-[acyl-carrier-protein] dehydratase
MSFSFVIKSDHPALAGHFPGRPVVPGVILLDHVAAAAKDAFGLGAPDGLPRVKFAAPVLPGEDVRIAMKRRGAARVIFTLRVGERVVATGDMTFAP